MLRVALAAVLVTPAAAAAPASPLQGLWLNPHGSVAVRTDPCGDKFCGRIVWASDAAQKDARESGVQTLIGTELLENYRPDGAARWSGTVFVPDMGRHFASRIVTLSPTRIEIKGCILGGLLCKAQVWSRIARLPQ